jgi:hypothetical protein
LTATHQRMVRIDDLSGLQRGDTIEARTYETVHYRGEIELIAPRLGVLWLRHGSWRHRKLLDPADYELWKLCAPGPAAPHKSPLTLTAHGAA